MEMTQEMRIKRAHVSMMKHPETAFYSGVMMMGETEVVDSKVTAYTDGVNKKYGRAFIEAVCAEDSALRGLILHENLHIAFRHLLHSRDLFMRDRALANKAADYVVNDVIMSIKDKAFITLPEGGLYDPKYHNMNMREVYRLLEEEQEEQEEQEKDKTSPEGEPQDGDGDGEGDAGPYQFDEHDISAGPMSAEEAQALEGQIDRAMREGALLAGRLGLKLPRQIQELLEPSVDWRKELAEFVSASCTGKDEYTWRRFNRRQLPNDLYLPSVEDETIGEVVVAIDTSGSIGQQQINEFASELASICDVVTPEAVRVLWWDTMVHGEQLFTPDKYASIGTLLKPLGGGGTAVSCVSQHIVKHEIKAECVIVFTDGFVEDKIKWDIAAPTLWLVTANKLWTPPAGHKVFVEK